MFSDQIVDVRVDFARNKGDISRSARPQTFCKPALIPSCLLKLDADSGFKCEDLFFIRHPVKFCDVTRDVKY